MINFKKVSVLLLLALSGAVAEENSTAINATATNATATNATATDGNSTSPAEPPPPPVDMSLPGSKAKTAVVKVTVASCL